LWWKGRKRYYVLDATGEILGAADRRILTAGKRRVQEYVKEK